MKKFHSALFDFCWFPNYDASIEYLANNIADPEPWDFSDATQAKYSILKSYIEHTFRKIKSENKISFSSDNINHEKNFIMGRGTWHNIKYDLLLQHTGPAWECKA